MNEGSEMRKRRSGRTAVRLALLGVALSFCLAAVASATAGILAVSPEPGSTVADARPVISVRAGDSVTMNQSASMSVDGAVVYPAVTYVENGGYWYDDGCEVYWVPTYDQTRVDVRYQPGPQLTDGSHSATVTVSNSLGEQTTQAWAFTVAQPPQITNATPATTTIAATATPVVSVRIADNGTFTRQMWIDGSPVPATWTTSTATFAYKTPPLAEGPHVAKVVATDTGGRSTTLEWTFTVRFSSSITFWSPTPAADATAGVGNPVVSVLASDVAPLNTSGTLYIDGAAFNRTLAFTDPYHGTIAVTPYSLIDGSHFATATVSDTAGFTSSFGWRFFVMAPPIVSAPSPADGSRVNTLTPTLSLTVAENGAAVGGTMTLDGIGVPAYYNPALKRLQYTPPAPISDRATHVVSATATDAAGLRASASWSFTTAAYPLSFFNAQPTGTATELGSSPVISVEMTDTDFIQSASAKLDGAIVAASIEDLTEGHWEGSGCDVYWVVTGTPHYRLSFQPANLSDAAHTVSFTATTTRQTTTHTWTFTQSSPPQLSALLPAGGTTVTTATPLISATVADNGAIASTAMYVDGAAVAASWDTGTKKLTYRPAAPLADDTSHSVRVTARDATGLTAEATWSFTVQVNPDMPSSGPCTSCHTTYPAAHPMANCGACHDGGRPVEDCRSCHGYGGHGPDAFDRTDWAGPYPCERCHTPAFADKVPQHSSSAETHSTSRDMSACRPCHVSSLTREHYRYTDAGGAKLTCATCHSSGDTTVRAAITAGNTDCESCHGLMASHSGFHAPDGIDARCGGCHRSDLTTEHLANPLTQTQPLACDSCHASARADVSWTAEGGGLDCGGCHSAAHGLAVSDETTGMPLYPGVTWERPQSAAVWANDDWMPAGLATGKLLVSARSGAITGDAVWAYYRDAMTAEGWTVTSAAPASGSAFYSVSFSRGSHSAVLFFYGGEAHTSAPVVPTGYRIELLYK